jgi:hypothetical protein
MRRGRDALGTAGKVPALLTVGATVQLTAGPIYRAEAVGFDNSLLREGALRVHNGFNGTNSGH